VMDTRPRRISKAEEAFLLLSAQQVMREIEGRGELEEPEPALA